MRPGAETSEGCVFTVGELKGMLEKAGFVEPRHLALPYWGDSSPVLLARKG